jgi:hypothetical protein
MKSDRSQEPNFALAHRLGLISGITVDAKGNLYLADQTYNTIRVVQWEASGQ